jgi:hypothetical protein
MAHRDGRALSRSATALCIYFSTCWGGGSRHCSSFRSATTSAALRPRLIVLFSWSDYSRSIVTGARSDIPSACAVAGVTSMIRPRTNGPRSLIVTTTERPLL